MKTQNQKNQNRKTKILALALQVVLGLSLMAGYSLKASAFVDLPPGVTDGLSNTIHLPERPIVRDDEPTIPCSVLRDRGGFRPNIPSAPNSPINDNLPVINCREDEPTPTPTPTPEAAPEQQEGAAPAAPADNTEAAIELPADPSALAGGGCSLALGADSSGLLPCLLMTIPLLFIRKPKKKG